MSATVLAVHNDIGFLSSLALRLERSRVNLIPAPSVRNLELLLAELQVEPDLLLINCKIQGVCAFAAESMKRWPKLKVVAIFSEGHRCLQCSHLLVGTIIDSQSPLIDGWVGLVLALTNIDSLVKSQ